MKKPNVYLSLLMLCFLIGISSCSKEDTSSLPHNESPNILFIIADDLGKDAINGYSEGSIKPITPTIDAIRNSGLTFNNFWVNPTCTPTRASIITGKYGYRTNVKGVGDVLSPSELSLQKYISDNTNNRYASALIGKWHLSGNNTFINPETFGIDYYAGLIRGAVDDYYQWQLSENNSNNLQTEYITEVFTDLAINWVKAQSKPWFLWLAYNAPHTPFHIPPTEMHNQGNLPAYSGGVDPIPYYMAAIEAMDYQIGRLLENLSATERENTIIIFIGDNGTPSQVAQFPYTSTSVKNTLYQGGINVPMFISGSGVSRFGVDDNLICATDLFATISEIAGHNVDQYHDSKSFKSLLSNNNYAIRDFQYAELADGVDDLWTVSNGQYKLLINANGNEEMYDLTIDPYEQNNLINQILTPAEINAKTELEAELKIIRQ